MSYHDVEFPTKIAYGSRGGPGFFTQVVLFEGGTDQRYPRWESERHRYDVRYGIRSMADVYEVYKFFKCRLGATHSFRFSDKFERTSCPSDGKTAPTKDDQQIGVGDGATTDFQLKKKYADSGRVHTRNITKPKFGTVKIAFDGTEQTSGWTCNYNTGVVTFTTAPGVGVDITAGYEFYVHVRFDESADRGLEWALQHFDGAAMESILLVEVKEEIPIDDDFLYGGGKNWGNVTADTAITHAEGRVHLFAPTVTMLKIRIPDPEDHKLGGPHFYLVNDGAYSMGIYDQAATPNFIKTIDPGAIVTIILAEDLAGNKEWRGK
jgi:uncharacterized protein (TIGR02217 family)